MAQPEKAAEPQAGGRNGPTDHSSRRGNQSPSRKRPASASRPQPPQPSWPQFRGPTGQGLADSADLPLTWTENRNVAWKTPIPGKGWSSPVLLDGQVWMTTATDQGRSLRAVAVDNNSGELLHDVEAFRVSAPARINDKNSYASPTPILEGDRVYVHLDRKARPHSTDRAGFCGRRRTSTTATAKRVSTAARACRRRWSGRC